MKQLNLLCLIIALSTVLYGQQKTQTVRGTVIDKDADFPLIGATIVRIGADVTEGTVTDEKGNFHLSDVPVGRQSFTVSYIGYEPRTVDNIMVNSAKETVLEIRLSESVTELGAVTVTADVQKDGSLNQMASVSARVFSVEEARRYAGGFDDPTRLASAFAGVSAPAIESNGISVRGNAPAMVQYRMEGVEIDNANHFEGGDMLGGGFVSIFNSHLLANSDFMTGAFPAEYGNALSATFDMKLRNGNSEKYEHAFQAGVMGFDLASEGPIKKGSGASYLFNYRYSTFGLIQNMLPEGEGLPVYQDLCFKTNIPTANAGTFGIWGAGAIDNFYMKAKTDSAEWNMEQKRTEIQADFLPAMGGITHKYLFKNRAYLKSSVLYTYNKRKETGKWLQNDLTLKKMVDMESTNNNITVSTYYNKKFNPRFTNRTGINAKAMFFEYEQKAAPNRNSDLVQIMSTDGNTMLLQAYNQSMYKVTENLSVNAGIHSQLLTLNKKYVIEPRFGTKWKAGKRLTFSAAYGRHSRMQMLNHYFIEKEDNGQTVLPNKDLDFTKAHHFVVGANYAIGKYTRIKVEPYYQLLSDIPVEENGSFAVINLQRPDDFDQAMKNGGTGTNVGVELTVERFLHNGFYYLATASVYDSRYKGSDGIERNTRYNGNFVGNLLAGKEWGFGADKNKFFGLNGRLYLNGGTRTSPIDYEASNEQKEIVYDETRLFEDQNPMTTRLDLTLSYTKNKEKYTTVLSLQMLNALGTTITYSNQYDYVKNQVVEMEGRDPLPNISWKIMF